MRMATTFVAAAAHISSYEYIGQGTRTFAMMNGDDMMEVDALPPPARTAASPASRATPRPAPDLSVNQVCTIDNYKLLKAGKHLDRSRVQYYLTKCKIEVSPGEGPASLLKKAEDRLKQLEAEPPSVALQESSAAANALTPHARQESNFSAAQASHRQPTAASLAQQRHAFAPILPAGAARDEASTSAEAGPSSRMSEQAAASPSSTITG